MSTSGVRASSLILLVALIAPFLCSLSHAACPEKILWSKRSPDKSLVFKNVNGKVQILICSLRLVESSEPGKAPTVRREFAGCEPLDPNRKEYLESDLIDDWNYVWRSHLTGKLKDAAFDFGVGFFVTVGGTVLGQRIARGIGSAGQVAADRAKAAGPRAEKAVRCADNFAGLGQSLTEGSRLVGNDLFLRFFPAYIGVGVGLAWNGVNETRHGDIRKALAAANTLSPANRGSDGSACDPTDLGDQTVEQFADSLKKALILAEARPNSAKKREEEERRRNMDPRVLNALNRPPQGPVRP